MGKARRTTEPPNEFLRNLGMERNEVDSLTWVDL